jgi:hypothetical protein
MLIPLGILASAGGIPPIVSDYELITTTVLGSTTPSITFNVSSFASTYKHLQIRAASLVNTNATLPFVRFNGDTANNYSLHYIEGNGSNVTSGGGGSNPWMYYGYWGTGSTTSAHAAVVDIVDAFSTTKFKTLRSFNGQAPGLITLYSGNWMNTAAITSITIESPNNFVAGSRFSIYGIKG